MSKDFQIAFPCTHQTILEPVQIGEDKVTLRISVGAIVVTDVALNGMSVPSEGLLSPALLTSGSPAPYRIYADATDLKITVTGDMEYDFVLPVGMNTTAEVKTLLEKGTDRIAVSVENGVLVLRDSFNLGPGSRIQVSGGAAAGLGFVQQRAASGREICPPWELSVPDSHGNAFPRFLYPPRHDKAARWRVSYDMHPDQCRRCMGSRVENDMRFRSNGDPGMVENENHLYQTVMKALLTERGSNAYHQWYGTNIMAMVGKKQSSGVAGAVKAEVQKTLDEIMSVQGALSKSQGLTLKERIASIDQVQCVAHPNDPTTLLVHVVVRNASGQRVKIGIVYTAPGAAGILTRDGKVIGRLGTSTSIG